MRYDSDFAYFYPHSEWYTFDKKNGYVPTEKAPEKAVIAMRNYNSRRFPNSDYKA